MFVQPQPIFDANSNFNGSVVVLAAPSVTATPDKEQTFSPTSSPGHYQQLMMTSSKTNFLANAIASDQKM